MKITLPLFPLFLVFLILKLTNTVDWSWWIVTAPLWIGFVVLGAFAMFFLIILLIKILSK